MRHTKRGDRTLERWTMEGRDRVVIEITEGLSLEMVRSDDGRGLQVRSLEGFLSVSPEAANTVTIVPALWPVREEADRG